MVGKISGNVYLADRERDERVTLRCVLGREIVRIGCVLGRKELTDYTCNLCSIYYGCDT
jgi:hypothetical protein